MTSRPADGSKFDDMYGAPLIFASSPAEKYGFRLRRNFSYLRSNRPVHWTARSGPVREIEAAWSSAKWLSAGWLTTLIVMFGWAFSKAATRFFVATALPSV